MSHKLRRKIELRGVIMKKSKLLILSLSALLSLGAIVSCGNSGSSEQSPSSSEKVEEKPEPKEDAPTATSIPEVKPHKTVGNSTFITFGRCKGKSLDETFEEDLSTLKWIAENIYDGPHEKLGNTVRRYLDFKKVNYAQKQAG